VETSSESAVGKASRAYGVDFMEIFTRSHVLSTKSSRVRSPLIFLNPSSIRRGP
jgi:hypothetical protein